MVVDRSETETRREARIYPLGKGDPAFVITVSNDTDKHGMWGEPKITMSAATLAGLEGARTLSDASRVTGEIVRAFRKI